MFRQNGDLFLLSFYFPQYKILRFVTETLCAVVHKFSPFYSHLFARLPLWTCRNYMVFESDVNTTGDTRSYCIVLDVGGSFSVCQRGSSSAIISRMYAKPNDDRSAWNDAHHLFRGVRWSVIVCDVETRSCSSLLVYLTASIRTRGINASR